MQNEEMTPAEWHNHEEYEADTDMLGMVDEEDEMGAWNYEGGSMLNEKEKFTFYMNCFTLLKS